MLDYFRKGKYKVEKLILTKYDKVIRNFYVSFKEKITNIVSALNIEMKIKFNIKKYICYQMKNYPKNYFTILHRLFGI